ncbi:MAG: proton-conducting transporter membrane subunit [Planctomycetaceae bacterium]
MFALYTACVVLSISVPERLISRATQTTVSIGLVSAVGVLVTMLYTGSRYVPVEMGNIVLVPNHEFHFHLKFVFDRLSVPFCILSFVLIGTVGAFANRYLHREPPYARFFLFYSMFLLGMVCASLAGTIETLFLGWELVGLSSALLIAYFHERQAPVANGQRVWSVYRIADAGFLLAAVALHHATGEGDFSGLMGSGPWPDGQASLSSSQALGIGSLLLFAAAGKSALIPFSGWMPRAMEGPTPSSAVFYGALSIHLGAYLLLRVSPILQLSTVLTAMVITLGAATAVFAALASRVQTDIKSSLAFASVTQVGIIVAEIGLGLYYLALCHIIGHACLRTLQLLRAPTLLRDYAMLENAIGGRLSSGTPVVVEWIPHGVKRSLYRFAIERGGFDATIERLLIHPIGTLFRYFDKWERSWTDLLSRSASRDSDAVPAVDAKEDWA